MMLLHNLVLFQYILISLMFAIAFYQRWKYHRKFNAPLMSLVVIFIFCALTRAMLDTGVLKDFDTAMHVILNLMCLWFIVTGKAAIIVKGNDGG